MALLLYYLRVGVAVLLYLLDACRGGNPAVACSMLACLDRAASQLASALLLCFLVTSSGGLAAVLESKWACGRAACCVFVLALRFCFFSQCLLWCGLLAAVLDVYCLAAVHFTTTLACCGGLLRWPCCCETKNAIGINPMLGLRRHLSAGIFCRIRGCFVLGVFDV